MKKLALLLLVCFYSSLLFAQKADTVTRFVDGTPMSPANDIVENASRSRELSTFVHATEIAGLTQSFKDNPAVTVFAPVNSAFEKLAPGKLDTLLSPAHKQELIKLLMYHAIAGKLSSRNIAKQIRLNNGQATFTTLSGGKLTAHIDGNRNIVLTDETGGQSIISKFDIQQRNGILDIITAVLAPAD